MSEQFVGAAWVDSLLAAMESIGLDVEALVVGLPGLSTSRLEGRQRIDIGSARRLYHRADHVADDPLLGLRLGERIDDGAIGFLGVLMWHGANLHQVLDDIATYQWAISENGGFERQVEDSREGGERLHVYEYVPVPNTIPANRHQIMTVVSSVIRSVRRITRGAVDVTALRIPSSLDAKKIGRHLGCAMEASAQNVAIAFRERDVEHPIAHRDAKLYELTKEYASALHQRTHQRRTLVEEIKTCVRDNGFVSATLAVVESEMGLHRRILQRMLADESTSFRELKEEVVRDEAVRRLLLADTKVALIAADLGYSEPSAFHRAFQNWFGITPGRFNRSDFYTL